MIAKFEYQTREEVLEKVQLTQRQINPSAGRRVIEVTENIVYPRAKQSTVVSCPGVVFTIDNVGHCRYNLTIRG
ncbi:MAG: hypothetical protein PHG61_09710 [Candidatus Marinimicrobia bacterium]|nr:hypothetical protein [Candidatus Neomarinimicrobiota bacterium]